jgi:hypothetical protein
MSLQNKTGRKKKRRKECSRTCSLCVWKDVHKMTGEMGTLHLQVERRDFKSKNKTFRKIPIMLHV